MTREVKDLLGLSEDFFTREIPKYGYNTCELCGMGHTHYETFFWRYIVKHYYLPMALMAIHDTPSTSVQLPALIANGDFSLELSRSTVGIRHWIVGYHKDILMIKGRLPRVSFDYELCFPINKRAHLRMLSDVRDIDDEREEAVQSFIYSDNYRLINWEDHGICTLF